jgi:hypothetical protein
MVPQSTVGRPWPSRPIRSLISKIGGTPVGLPNGSWPVCRQCARHMDFLLQLDLRVPAPLSHRFRFAYLFSCSGYLDGRSECRTWDPLFGSNRIILIESPNPADHSPNRAPRKWPEFRLEFGQSMAGRAGESRIPFTEIFDEAGPHQTVHLCHRIVGRSPRAAHRRSARVRWTTLLSTPRHRWVYVRIAYHPPETVSLGGEPQWLQRDERPLCPRCGGRMKLLAQINAELEDTFLKKRPPMLLPFGDAGVAYAFLCEAECSPDSSAMLWQTT